MLAALFSQVEDLRHIATLLYFWKSDSAILTLVLIDNFVECKVHQIFDGYALSGCYCPYLRYLVIVCHRAESNDLALRCRATTFDRLPLLVISLTYRGYFLF